MIHGAYFCYCSRFHDNSLMYNLARSYYLQFSDNLIFIGYTICYLYDLKLFRTKVEPTQGLSETRKRSTSIVIRVRLAMQFCDLSGNITVHVCFV
jgi:hypothetical protein